MPGVILEPLAGCIKWLPRKDELIPTEPDIEEGCCNHPVVVLSTQSRNGRVEILIITSFGGQDLETKYPTQLDARHDHLPIAPSNAHPDNNILLVLRDKSPKLKKNSYVKTREKFKIRLASLRPYNRQGPEVFLSERSYKILIKHIQFTEPQPDPVSYSLGTPSSRSRISREVSIGVERSAAADVEFLLNYHTRTAESNRSILPTTHPIQPGHEGDSPKPIDWAKFWKLVKMYKAFKSIGERIKSLWVSLRQKLGLWFTGHQIGSLRLLFLLLSWHGAY
ncbi:hypothetical protein GGR58DRAFT_494705 [Xylaria digitata]|nr:hypothetical protein GGR58DRAFT_494705 [Xylaria digitata]